MVNVILNIYNFWRILCAYMEKLKRGVFQYRDDLSMSRIIYYDFETTGLNPYHDRIIEYAFLDESNQDFINELVDPECKFEKKITDITGIHPDELQNKDPIEKHIKGIVDYINPDNSRIGFQTYLIAHNNDSFDKIFLNETLIRFNDMLVNINDFGRLKFFGKHIDTLLLAKKLLPELRSHSLKSLATYFKIKAGTHRAIDDTRCLREIYHKLLEVMSTKYIYNEEYQTPNMLLNNPSIVYNYLYRTH